MSVIGVVIAYKCDGCDTSKCVNTDDGFEEFAEQWFVGLNSDFCPVCRTRPDDFFQGAIASEERDMRNAERRMRLRLTRMIQNPKFKIHNRAAAEVANVH